MKDPLTKKQRKEMLAEFKEEFDKKYAQLLKVADNIIEKDIAKDGMPFQKGSYVLARIALIKAAEGFRLFSSFKELEFDLNKYI